MGTISLTFTGASMEEVARLVTAWAPPPVAGPPATSAQAMQPEPPDNGSDVRRVVTRFHGKPTLRLLRVIAEAGLKGERVELTESLIHDFGSTSGSAFGGMVGRVNTVAAKIMGGSLIHYPEPELSIWRMTPDDARVVLDVLDGN